MSITTFRLIRATVTADLMFGIFLFGILLGGAAMKPQKPSAPVGYMDVPMNGVTVKNIVPLMGWALAEGGVASVSIYIDRQYVMDARLGLPRPDVQQRYPLKANAAISGWAADLTMDGFKPGLHVITAELRANTGSRTKIRAGVNLQ